MNTDEWLALYQSARSSLENAQNLTTLQRQTLYMQFAQAARTLSVGNRNFANEWYSSIPGSWSNVGVSSIPAASGSTGLPNHGWLYSNSGSIGSGTRRSLGFDMRADRFGSVTYIASTGATAGDVGGGLMGMGDFNFGIVTALRGEPSAMRFIDAKAFADGNR